MRELDTKYQCTICYRYEVVRLSRDEALELSDQFLISGRAYPVACWLSLFVHLGLLGQSQRG